MDRLPERHVGCDLCQWHLRGRRRDLREHRRNGREPKHDRLVGRVSIDTGHQDPDPPEVRDENMNFFRDESGAAALEAALVLPFYLAFIFAILELGNIYWLYNSIQYVA